MPVINRYHWWSVFTWGVRGHSWGVKLGPVTLSVYPSVTDLCVFGKAIYVAFKCAGGCGRRMRGTLAICAKCTEGAK